MKSKLFTFLLLLLPSICFGYYPDDKIDSPEEVSRLNNDFRRLTIGKLDIRPGSILPKIDSTFDLGAVGYEWKNLYVDTITASNLTVSTLTLTSVANGQNSLGKSNIIEAWVNFSSTGTVFIRSSYNISSVDDDGVPGAFTINFINAFEDANYAMSGAATYDGSNNLGVGVCFKNTAAPAAASCQINVVNSTGAKVDSPYITLMFVR